MPPIPLKVYITPFADKGVVEPAKWDCDQAKNALNVVNAIWAKAKISFVISDCIVDKPLDMDKSARKSGQKVLDTLSLRRGPDNFVHIFLINMVEGLTEGGLSYPDSNPEPASFVQRYDDDAGKGRAWAHELGHLMSLEHAERDSPNAKDAAKLSANLMREGLTVARDLTDKQIGQAKASKLVKRFGG